MPGSVFYDPRTCRQFVGLLTGQGLQAQQGEDEETYGVASAHTAGAVEYPDPASLVWAFSVAWRVRARMPPASPVRRVPRRRT